MRKVIEKQYDLNPETWVDEHGDILFRYALVRLHDEVTAEDVVQETFLAAIKSRDRFSGRSSERTWLIGILKHKIVDHIRKAIRQRPYEDLEAADELSEKLFNANGSWQAKPLEWRVSPSKLLERKEFRAVLQKCLAHLDHRLRSVFTLRELEDQDSGKICKALDITPTNLWVMFYRARMRLRSCLDKNWFEMEEK